MWTRAELKDNAKKFFKFNYWKMVLVALALTIVGGGGVSFNYTQSYQQGVDEFHDFRVPRMDPSELAVMIVAILIAVIIVCVIAGALQWFVFNPIYIGAQRFFVVSHYRKAELGELGFAFSKSYLNTVKVMFLRQMYIFLWTLLFIIPGVIKAYEYAMIPYILAENPDIDSKEAFAASKQMMTGNKWNLFVLQLSFLGWNLLSVCTCGILSIFYVNPYMYMTLAEFYVALKEITYGGGQNPYDRSGQNQWNSDNSQWNDQNRWDGNNRWDGQNRWNGNNQWNDSNQPNGGDQWNDPNQPNGGNWN